jgi:hypothetical protein
MSETVSESLAYFQWTRGENLGDIETWEGETDDNDGETFYIFKSGKMANMNLEGEFFMKITSPSEPIIDPIGMEGTFTQLTPKVQKPRLEKKATEPKLKQETNPVFSLLDKSIKAETIQSLKVTLSLPARDLIKVVASSFEDGQENILDYLVSQISIEELQKQIKEQLRSSLFGRKIKERNEQ